MIQQNSNAKKKSIERKLVQSIVTVFIGVVIVSCSPLTIKLIVLVPLA